MCSGKFLEQLSLLFTSFLIFFLQVYVQTWNTPNLSMIITRDEYPSHPMVLRGINQRAISPQYQPVVMLEKGYTIHWSGPAPRTTFLYLVNFNK